MDDYEFHYPDELNRDNLDEVREALDGHGIYCLASGLHLDPRNGKGGSPRPTTPCATRRCEVTLDACEFAGEIGAHFIIWPGIEGYNYPFQTPYRESWARFIDGVGQAATALAGARQEALPRAQELRAGDEDLHAQHRDDAARHPQAARRGDRQHPGQHGLAAPAHERRAPAGVRRAAGRRGAARPPARQLGLGHLRRRQHGRRDRVHGDASSSRSSCAGPTTAPTASGSASTSTRTPRTRSRPSSARSSSGTSSTRSAQRIDGEALREAQQRKDAVARLRARLRGAGRPAPSRV